jgi:hypothetical protein
LPSDADRSWIAFMEAEQNFREALVDLRRFDLESILKTGLSKLTWRRQALVVLAAYDWPLTETLLPELLPLSLSAHSLLAEVRRCVLRVPREKLVVHLASLVESVVNNPDSDYEAYRRTAELVDTVHADALLLTLITAAERSSDADIREVADDFREP